MSAARFEQRGQALVEYLVVAGVAVLLVAVMTSGEQSLVDAFLEAVKTAWDRFLGALSLPQ